jgi:hypothetical protein
MAHSQSVRVEVLFDYHSLAWGCISTKAAAAESKLFVFDMIDQQATRQVICTVPVQGKYE